MFEKATRLKLRFETPRGQISVEDLWDLPLNSGTGKPNLDDIAKAANRELRSSAETESFVQPVSTAGNELLQLRFDVVKHVIDVRVAERNAAQEAAKRRETKQRILEIVATKEDEALRGKSLEELKAMAEAM